MSSSICNPCGWEAATAGSNSYFPTLRPCSLPGLSRARTGRGLPSPAPPPRRPPSPPLHPILRSPRAQCGKYEFPLSFLGNFRSSSFSRSPLRPPPPRRPLPARPLRPRERRPSSRPAPLRSAPAPRGSAGSATAAPQPEGREGRQSPGGGPGSALGRAHGAGHRDLQPPPTRLSVRCGAEPGTEQRRGPLAAAEEAEGMPERHKAGGGSSSRLVPGWGRRAGSA